MTEMKKALRRVIVFFYSSANPQTTTYFRDSVTSGKNAQKVATSKPPRAAAVRP